MTVHQDYEIKINLNELIEKRIPCCDLLHPDHCLTEKQVSEIAHDIRMDLNLHDLYKQVDQHIMNYVNAAGIDNKDHWVEPHLPDLERDLKEEVGIEFDWFFFLLNTINICIFFLNHLSIYKYF